MLIEIPLSLLCVLALVIGGFTYTASTLLDRAIERRRQLNQQASESATELELDTLAA